MQHLADPKLVPEVYGPYPHAACPSNTKQISDFFSFRYFAGGWLSFTCTKLWKGASVNFFVWQFSIETFPCSMAALQNLSHQVKAPFTSQGSQDLVKLLPLWGSLTFIKYKWQFVISISLEMFFKSSGSKWHETDGNEQNLCFCLQVQKINANSINRCFTERKRSGNPDSKVFSGLREKAKGGLTGGTLAPFTNLDWVDPRWQPAALWS